MELKYPVIAAVVLLVIFVMTKGKSRPTVSNATEQDIKDMVRAGNKVRAIKHYRAMHRVGLKEAKDAIDALAKTL